MNHNYSHYGHYHQGQWLMYVISGVNTDCNSMHWNAYFSFYILMILQLDQLTAEVVGNWKLSSRLESSAVTGSSFSGQYFWNSFALPHPQFFYKWQGTSHCWWGGSHSPPATNKSSYGTSVDHLWLAHEWAVAYWLKITGLRGGSPIAIPENTRNWTWDVQHAKHLLKNIHLFRLSYWNASIM